MLTYRFNGRLNYYRSIVLKVAKLKFEIKKRLTAIHQKIK